MFNEKNAVEEFISSLLQQTERPVAPGIAESARRISPVWYHASSHLLDRLTTDVFVTTDLRDALVRLNPEIAAQASRADEVIYRLRAILVGVHADGLVKANEEFTAWLRGERSMPFGLNNEHRPVLDAAQPHDQRHLRQH